MRDRYDVRITLRMVSVLLLGAALGLSVYRPCAMMIHWDRYAGADWLLLWKSLLMQMRMNELPLAMPLMVLAVMLWLLQKPLTRLIAPKAGAICRECGYSLRGSNGGGRGGRCPECGFEIAANRTDISKQDVNES